MCGTWISLLLFAREQVGQQLCRLIHTAPVWENVNMIIFKGKCYQDLVQLTLKSNRRFSIAIQIYQYWLDPQKVAINNPRGRGYSTNVYTGRLRPEVQPLTLFNICHFSRKRYPFCIPSIDKWYPFHIPCLEHCILFNCCKCTVF